MKKWICFTLLILLVLSGCSKKNTNDAQNRDGIYKIYYLDSKTSGIVSEDYKPSKTTKEDLVKELLDVLQKEPKKMVYKKALPDDVIIKEYSIADDQLTINFSKNYDELKGISEVLCRATFVKTLCQISGINYVQFNVNDQPLKDSNGIVNRFMTADDFIENSGAETNNMVTLYFANKDGSALVESKTNIYNSGTGSMEERVINQLINGPTRTGLYNTVPEGTTLLNVTTKEGICYVDFNEKFLDTMPNVSDQVRIYSIVNSLVDIPNLNISKVQFLINGAVKDTFGENTAFNGFFERKLDIIKGNK